MKTAMLCALLTAVPVLADPPAPVETPGARAETPATAPAALPPAGAEVVAEAAFVPGTPSSTDYLLDGLTPGVIRPEALPEGAVARELQLDRSRYGGTLGEALLTERPLQLFNPLAPAEFGDGTRHLTQDVFTGRAEGVVLFSFRIGGGDSAKSLNRTRTPFWRRKRAEPPPP